MVILCIYSAVHSHAFLQNISLTCSPPAHEVNPSLSPTAFARRHELVVLRAQAETTRDRRVVGVDGGDAFHGYGTGGLLGRSQGKFGGIIHGRPNFVLSAVFHSPINDGTLVLDE